LFLCKCRVFPFLEKNRYIRASHFGCYQLLQIIFLSKYPDFLQHFLGNLPAIFWQSFGNFVPESVVKPKIQNRR